MYYQIYNVYQIIQCAQVPLKHYILVAFIDNVYVVYLWDVSVS